MKQVLISQVLENTEAVVIISLCDKDGNILSTAEVPFPYMKPGEMVIVQFAAHETGENTDA